MVKKKQLLKGPYLFFFTVLLTVLLAGAFEGVGFAQSLKLSVETRDIYADLPFVLNVSAEGFEETPEPKAPELKIEGADVRYLGMSPSVRSSLSIINGRRTENKSVNFVYRFKVTALKEGNYKIPKIVVEQGGRSASTQESQFKAKAMTSTTDMKISVSLPNRALWIGESVPITIDWYLRRDPRDQNFVIPLFDDSIVDVDAPEANGRRGLEFSAGAKNLELPYDSEKIMEDGIQYSRFRFHALIRPKEIGTHSLAAPKVIAELAQGRARDSWGFPTTKYGRFKAEGSPQTLQVKGVPLTGKPDGFSGAVGQSFSWNIEASKTLVAVGEPIELTVTIRSENGLDGLALPDLHAAGLPQDSFELPSEAVAGELSEDGTSKVFKVVARVTSNKVRDIPPLSLSYFDPNTGKYGESKSQAIALSVEGANVVGAKDVIGANRRDEQNGEQASAQLEEQSTQVVGADLSLSDPNVSKQSSNKVQWPLFAFYGGSSLFFLFALWRRKTETSRLSHSKRKTSLKDFKKAIADAKATPAKDSSSVVLAAYKRCVKELGLDPNDSWVAEIENAAYDPKASGEPLSNTLLNKGLESIEVNKSKSKAAQAVAVLILVCSCFGWGESQAQNTARDSYNQALSEKDSNTKRALFEQALSGFQRKLNETPKDPDLLCDVGQAALGASDFGRAVLSYKRALALDPSQKRARQNLGWVRQRMPPWSVPKEANVSESFVFWHYRWSKHKKHWLAAMGFALSLFLVSPIGGALSLRKKIAFLPGLLFVTMAISLLLSQKISTDAVVIQDGEVLRSADSQGAPPILSTPLLSGIEVELREVRSGWAKVKLANSTEGWLRSDAVVLVSPPK